LFPNPREAPSVDGNPCVKCSSSRAGARVRCRGFGFSVPTLDP